LATRLPSGSLAPTEHAALAAGDDALTTYAEAVDQIEQLVATDEQLLELVHRTSHHLLLATRAMHALGVGAPRSAGTIAGLFASGGGVPKQPIDEAVIGYRGVDGDRQHSREHHGRVWQALCLWSADVIERLQSEGHPIAPGNAGENVTIAGVDWPSLRPGTRIAIGDDVLVEVSAYATPCKKNKAWFLDGDFNRMNHDREQGVSRVYASVLRDGVIRPNDPVIVEP
jgi:MOSC domain-containing protein YiiM